MLCAGAKSFYRSRRCERQPRNRILRSAPAPATETWNRGPASLVLADLKRARGVVKTNAGASLIDLGDGVLCCEFHSKMNAHRRRHLHMLRAGLAELEAELRRHGDRQPGRELLSVGANLMMVLLAAQEDEWDELNAAVHRFQQMNMALKYAPKPVVAAPFGMALGGGCEIAAALRRAFRRRPNSIWAWWRSGVGLIPAGGGCKEMLLRSRDIKKIFEQIGFAKVSTSAVEARAVPLPARWRRHLDESRTADRRCEATCALAGSWLCAGRAAHRYRRFPAKPALR